MAMLDYVRDGDNLYIESMYSFSNMTFKVKRLFLSVFITDLALAEW